MRDLSRSVMFHKPPPLLRNLELLGIPSDFFFADPSISLVSNLTHLELGTVPHLPPLRGLHELLLRNPRLESLFLDMSMVDQVHLSIGFPEGANINLPCLRRFALKEPRSTDWALSILRMIDAPGVEEFTLDLSHTQHPVLPGVVALYVACGRESGRLINAHFLTQRDHIHQSFPNIGPLFPVLRHLKLGAFPDDPKYLELLLRFQGSTITRLDWELEESCEGAILELAKSPAPCRRLEHLRVYGVPSDELVELVQSRISLGVPLKIIEINSRDWSSISKEVKEHLGSVLDKFGQYVDENESDSDEDSDWTDTDDEDDDNSDGSTSDSTGSEASG
ncbi:hypothetical protein FRC12_023191 [Ceratobasidium sp. 428]|nr:hypothetical protein FRC12_023191 [Ceratobasidium sp. 428]